MAKVIYKGLMTEEDYKQREGLTLTFVRPGMPGLKERAERQKKLEEEAQAKHQPPPQQQNSLDQK